MLSLRDDEFLIDAARYNETITRELSTGLKGLIGMISYEYSYKQETPVY